MHCSENRMLCRDILFMHLGCPICTLLTTESIQASGGQCRGCIPRHSEAPIQYSFVFINTGAPRGVSNAVNVLNKASTSTLEGACSHTPHVHGLAQ